MGGPAKVHKLGDRRFFFLGEDLHRVLWINRGRDLLEAFSLTRGERVFYNYTDAHRTHQRAWKTAEVEGFLNRDRDRFHVAWYTGAVEKPQQSYNLDEDGKKIFTHKKKGFGPRTGNLYYHERNIMELLDWFSTQRPGPKPKEPWRGGDTRGLPTPRELRARMKNEDVLYIKVDDDTYIPTWRAG